VTPFDFHTATGSGKKELARASEKDNAIPIRPVPGPVSAFLHCENLGSPDGRDFRARSNACPRSPRAPHQGHLRERCWPRAQLLEHARGFSQALVRRLGPTGECSGAFHDSTIAIAIATLLNTT